MVGDKSHEDDPLREKMGKRNSTLREKLSVSLHTHTHPVCMCDVVAAELSCVAQVRGGCVEREKKKKTKFGPKGALSVSRPKMGVPRAGRRLTVERRSSTAEVRGRPKSEGGRSPKLLLLQQVVVVVVVVVVAVAAA